MKTIIIIFVSISIISCRQKTNSTVSFEQVPPIYYLKTNKNISYTNDVVYLNSKKYSGYLYLLHEKSKDTLSKVGYVDGIENGLSQKWYASKQLMEERHYVAGKKHGTQTGYWENGNKRFEFMAINDAYEGSLKEWDYDGRLFHLGNYVNGQEDGLQKMWYENGKIRANYLIIKGKRYGLLGTKNCKNVSDSIFVVK